MPVITRFGIVALVAAGCSAPPAPDVVSLTDATDNSHSMDAAIDSPETGLDVSLGIPRAGTDHTLDIATWNLRMFPSTLESPALVAESIREMDVDLVAVQEVLSQAAFDELLSRLPGYEGILSERVVPPRLTRAFVYRSSALSLMRHELLFEGQWVRPPFLATFAYTDGSVHFTFDAVTVHLKAGGTAANIAERTMQTTQLEQAIRDRMATGDLATLIVLGDFNETFFGRDAPTVWGPFLDAPLRYTIETHALARTPEYSHLSGSFLDHMVTSTAMHGSVGDASPGVMHLDRIIDQYEARVSDHLPVWIRLDPH